MSAAPVCRMSPERDAFYCIGLRITRYYKTERVGTIIRFQASYKLIFIPVRGKDVIRKYTFVSNCHIFNVTTTLRTLISVIRHVHLTRIRSTNASIMLALYIVHVLRILNEEVSWSLNTPRWVVLPLSRRRNDTVRMIGRSDFIISSVWTSSSMCPSVAIICSTSQYL